MGFFGKCPLGRLDKALALDHRTSCKFILCQAPRDIGIKKFLEHDCHCGAARAATLYFYSLLRSAYGGGHIVCWFQACFPKSVCPRVCLSHVIVCSFIDHK